MSFLVLSDEDIRNGLPTDKYFIWTERILQERRVNPTVVAEITTTKWGIFAGLNDVLELMKGKPVDVYSIPEGTLFFPNQPVMFIVGKYLDFARFETPLLGLICHTSGVSTMAFKIKLAAGDKNVFSFGTRRQHPVLAAVIERAAYIGGVDGVSNYAAEEYLGLPSVGTMPHSLIISFGDQIKAWRAFDEIIDKDVPRSILVDTYCDEKTETIMAVENVKRVDGVRLDTPGTRRGNMRKIVEEVKWELKIRGREDVKIIISGGTDIGDILGLRDIVDAFGVGTSISAAKPIDFALDIVEREGKFVAKRSKRGGMKQIYRDWNLLKDEVTLFNQDTGGKEPLLKKYIENGKIVLDTDMEEARKLVLKQIKLVKELKREIEFLSHV